jgi:hypothetical protein
MTVWKEKLKRTTVAYFKILPAKKKGTTEKFAAKL